MSAEIGVILVNFNSGSDLVRCLDALGRQSRPAQITVVDNASTDNSLHDAYERFPSHRYLPFRRNVGFARAVNLAVQRIDTPLIVLLNPDTIPHRDFVEAIARPLEENEEAAAVAGALVFESAPHLVASTGIRVHGNGVAVDAGLGEPLAGQRRRAVFGASGGAACYRRQAFLDAGGFPEVFFMYLEDVDLAWRLRLLGWEAVSEPAAIAVHRYSGASGEGSSFKRRLLARNRIWTLARCLPDELWRRDFRHIVTYDGGALVYGSLADRAAAAGRLEALARIAPRLCERRRIQAKPQANVTEIERWIKPPISPFELRRLRTLTAEYAAIDQTH